MRELNQAFVKKQIDDMLEKQFIKILKAPIGAPVRVVSRKDGKNACKVYRSLNNITIKDSTIPSLMIDCLSSNIQGKRWFSKAVRL